MEQLLSTEYIVSILLSGISLGGQLALIAIGYTMVYGILRLINFAHGDVFMVAGLVMVYATTAMPFYIALPLVLVVTVVLGFLIERVAYKPLRTAPRMSVMISAIGVSYLIQNLAFYITGGVPQPVSNPIPWISENVSILGTSTKRVTLVTPVLTILLVIVLVYLINHTKIGMAMRAAAKDFETAQLMGIKINAVISMTFVIGSFLAAIGRRYAGAEGLRGGGVRRYRLHSRRGCRRIHHRTVRGGHQGTGLYHLLRRVYLCPADRGAVREAHRPVR